jgi:hypothetical protein
MHLARQLPTLSADRSAYPGEDHRWGSGSAPLAVHHSAQPVVSFSSFASKNEVTSWSLGRRLMILHHVLRRSLPLGLGIDPCAIMDLVSATSRPARAHHYLMDANNGARVVKVSRVPATVLRRAGDELLA